MLGFLLILLLVAFISHVLAKASEPESIENAFKKMDKVCPPHAWDFKQLGKINGDDTYYMVCQRCGRKPDDA